jgi:hypothetical protein
MKLGSVNTCGMPQGRYASQVSMACDTWLVDTCLQKLFQQCTCSPATDKSDDGHALTFGASHLLVPFLQLSWCLLLTWLPTSQPTFCADVQ